MKKLLVALLTLALLLSLTCSGLTAYAAEGAPTTVEQNSSAKGYICNVTTYATLRQSTSTSSKSLRKLNNGVTVTILGYDGDWVNVSYDGITGYVPSKYISYDAPSETPAQGTGYIFNVNSYVTLRQSTSTDSQALSKLDKGTAVDIVGYSGDWVKVSYGGATGYVLSKYVSNDAPGSSSDASAQGTGYISNVSAYATLRKSASSSSKALRKLDKGAAVDIVGFSGDWVKVSYDGTTGYVPSKYISNSAPDNSSSQGGGKFSLIQFDDDEWYTHNHLTNSKYFTYKNYSKKLKTPGGKTVYDLSFEYPKFKKNSGVYAKLNSEINSDLNDVISEYNYHKNLNMDSEYKERLEDGRTSPYCYEGHINVTYCDSNYVSIVMVIFDNYIDTAGYNFTVDASIYNVKTGKKISAASYMGISESQLDEMTERGIAETNGGFDDGGLAYCLTSKGIEAYFVNFSRCCDISALLIPKSMYY